MRFAELENGEDRMRVAAIGRTKNLYNSITKVKDGGHDIALIITCKESPGYEIVANDFKLLAKSLGIDFAQTERINSPEVIRLIKKNKPDIGISINWKTIIGQEVLNCFPYGVVNAHAGELPRYRGNAAPNWAIINGEKKIVMTAHLMTVELDAGPVILRQEMPVSDKTCISEAYEFIEKACPEGLLKAINGLANGSIKPRPQPTDASLSLRCYPRIPRDGEIDWRQSAVKLDRLVRAVSTPFDGAYTFMGIEKLIIWKAHYETPPYPFVGTPGQVAERRPETGEVAVITGEGFLVIEEVETITSGRKKAAEIVGTIRTRLGMDLAGEIMRLNGELEKIKKAVRGNKSVAGK